MSPSLEQKHSAADSALREFIGAPDSASAEEHLETLLTRHAIPLIQTVLKCKVASSSARSSVREYQEQEDICGDAIFQLLRHLKKLRELQDLESIKNFRGYVIQTALNAFNGYLREKYPRRWQLKCRLRYLLDHRKSFLTWKLDSGDIVCGLREWGDKDASALLEGASALIREILSTADKKKLREDAEEFLRRLLTRYGSPVLLDELVASLAEFADVSEIRYLSEDYTSVGDLLPSPLPDPAAQLEQKLYLTHLWREICELPVKQRAALLLNLRDPTGADALMLFVVTDVTRLSGIAAVLDWTPEVFAQLWNHLPLDDNTIAERIGVTRQQVINLRKSARERLARRMAAGNLRTGSATGR
ncbi:MAG TPA: hypothetical protein VKD70_01200 [Candidatus Acidoferrum sp.]|nr:hypothetical protein [Candidatus Acidoferrum sp.]